MRKDENGSTPLHFDKQPEAVKILIDAGADVNARTKKNGLWGETPLDYAAHYGESEAVKILIDAGADVNTNIFYGVKKSETIKILIDTGVDFNAGS